MVLQTSCRCLRVVVRGDPETALIFLNDKNAGHLEKQLEETQRIDLKTFQSGQADEGIVRHSRMKKLGLPMIDHVLFELSREMTVTELEAADIVQGIHETASRCRVSVSIESIENLDFTGNATSYEHANLRHGTRPVSYRKWKHDLLNEAGPVPERLEEYAAGAEGDAALSSLFETLTDDIDGSTFYIPGYDQVRARSIVRSLFYPRREVRVEIEEVSDIAFASFVDEGSLKPVHGVPRDEFYPDEQRESEVLAADESKLPENLQAAYDTLIAAGQAEVASNMLAG